VRAKVKLSELKPNPFKKFIQEGRIDPLVVKQIKESMSKTSVWEQWVVREAEEGYEIAFGHHRLKAAIELLGKEHEVSVQVEKYDDDRMFFALADENAGPEESVEAQCDVVVAARERLLKNPELCKQLAHDEPPVAKHGHAQHEHGSERCVAAYLGEENWSRPKVNRLLQLANNFDKSLLKDIAPEGGKNGSDRRKRIGVNAALELAKLPKKAQRAVMREAQKAEVGVREIKEIVSASAKQPERAGEIAKDIIAASGPLVLSVQVREKTKEFATFIKETAEEGRRFSKKLARILEFKAEFDNDIYRRTLSRTYLESVCRDINKQSGNLFGGE
jgi:ParB-like nuclease family protein